MRVIASFLFCFLISLNARANRACGDAIERVVLQRWPREKICEVLKGLEAQFPVHYRAIRYPSPEFLAAAERLARHPVSGQMMSSAILRRFDSFKAAFEFCKVETEQFPEAVPWTLEDLRNVLKALWAAGHPIHNKGIRYASPAMLVLVEKTLGRHVSGPNVLKAGLRRFKTWNKVLEYFEYDLREVARRIKPTWNPNWEEEPVALGTQREWMDLGDNRGQDAAIIGRPALPALAIVENTEILGVVQAAAAEGLSEEDRAKLQVLIEAIVSHPNTLQTKNLRKVVRGMGAVDLSSEDVARLLQFLRTHPNLAKFRQAS